MDLSLREAAKLLDVSESTLSRWIDDERLPAFMINGRYRFNRVDLMEWASRRSLSASRLYEHPDSRGTAPLHAILEGHIHHDVPGSDMKSVMSAVAARLPLPAPRDQALAAQALAEREAHVSTIVADGIAIPHVRSPLVFPVDRPLLTLCLLKEPVAFGPDRAPVRVVFALVTPTVRAHLAMLAKISAALHDGAFRKLLDERAPAGALLARLKELG